MVAPAVVAQPDNPYPIRGSIQRIEIKNLLSFGSEGVSLDLLPLNVLIGPNAAGKSNLIEVIRLLAWAPADLTQGIYAGGGVDEWLWKGGTSSPIGYIKAHVQGPGSDSIQHSIEILREGQRLLLSAEHIALVGQDNAFTYDRRSGGDAEFNWINRGGASRRSETLSKVKLDQSMLSQRKHPEAYPELHHLSTSYDSYAFLTDWTMGRSGAPRVPQRPDVKQDFLSTDAANLALVLNDILFHPGVEEKIMERLRVVYERAQGLLTRVAGGTVQLFIREKGLNSPIPATRLSDGTLRFLALLSVLYHPKPPPLVCIEEPELGLHPDAIETVAEMLMEASQRMQLIVTTHSDLLISHFTEMPEVVVVCDQGPDGTWFRRLPPYQKGDEEEGSLGHRWLKGQIGGTRW